MTQDRNSSIGTTSGPMLVLPAELAGTWEGARPPSDGREIRARSLSNDNEEPASNLDVVMDALAVEFDVAGVPVGPGLGIALRHGVAEVTEWRGHTVILNDADLETLEQRWQQEGASMWEYTPHRLNCESGRLRVLDAADGGSPAAHGADSTLLEHTLVSGPGLYAVDKSPRLLPVKDSAGGNAIRLRRVDDATDEPQDGEVARKARAAWRERMKQAGVKDSWRLVASMRDRIRIHTIVKNLERFRSVGTSRFGGPADLPSTDHWPQQEGLNYTFLCQIDLNDIASLDVGRRLPDHGLLSFFVGTPAVYDGQTEHFVTGRVLWFADTSNLTGCSHSGGNPRVRGMTFELSPVPPPWNSEFILAVDNPPYCDVHDQTEQPSHTPRTALFGFDRVYEQALQPTEEMLLICWDGEDIDYPFYEAVTLSFAIDRGALFRRDFSEVRCWETPTI